MEGYTPIIISVLGFVFICLMISRMIRKTPASREAGTFGRAHEELRVKDQLDELLLQIQEASRENIARLDTKIRMLNQLIADADQKKKELEALVYGDAPPQKEKPPPQEKPRAPERPPDPLHEKVYSLRDEGKSPAEISAITGRDVGEIELILGLRDAK
ncbi:MAG: hypothetical protein ACYTAF_00755 [Planctomycetota bacterium]